MDSKKLASYKKNYDRAEKAQRPGGEFDWYAIDADDHIAAFVTAGFGPVPELVFEIGIDLYLALVELIEDKLDHSLAIYSGGFLPYSERGLFAFDFCAWESGQYEISATPAVPLKLADAIGIGFEKKMFVPFKEKFSEVVQIIPEDHWRCR